MAAAAFRSQARKLELPELLELADLIREASEHPGYQFVQASIDAHRALMLARLLNETTKPEEITRLRGLIAGLDSMREATESILALADEREAEAKRQLESHV